MTYKLYLRIPHFLAIDRAVLILSPVTIRTVIPAFLHFRIASGTSSRTGSSIPTIAIRVRSAIILSSSSQSLPSAGRSLIIEVFNEFYMYIWFRFLLECDSDGSEPFLCKLFDNIFHHIIFLGFCKIDRAVIGHTFRAFSKDNFGSSL